MYLRPAETFATVAQLDTVSKTELRLCIAQPALSWQITHRGPHRPDWRRRKVNEHMACSRFVNLPNRSFPCTKEAGDRRAGIRSSSGMWR